MNKDAWAQKFKARLMSRGSLTAAAAEAVYQNGVKYDEHDYTIPAEQAADDEMRYWGGTYD